MSRVLIISATTGSNLILANKIGDLLDLDNEIITLEDFPMPLYTPKVQNIDDASFKSLCEKFIISDGLIFCAPEYNGGLPPILTNAFTWISVTTANWRDGFKDKYAVIATRSAGSGQRFLIAFRSQLEYMGTLVMPKTIVVTNTQSLNRKSAERTLQHLIHLLSK